MPGESLKEYFRSASHRFRQHPAVSFYKEGHLGKSLSYSELAREARKLSNFFIQSGLMKGDRVILFLDKCLFSVVAHLALQQIGAVSVPLNPGFKKAEVNYFIHDAEPSLVILGLPQEGVLRGIDGRFDVVTIDTTAPYDEVDFFRSFPDDESQTDILPEDPGVIIYTSGTTGSPKGAVLTQRNLSHDATNIIKIWEICGSDVLCHALPLFHVHGLCFGLHTSLIAGCHVLLLDKFSAETAMNLLRSHSTVFMAVPAMYAKLMEYLGDGRPQFSRMRLWTSGSAPLLPRDFMRITEIFGKEPVEREGMTETGMNFSNPLKGKKIPGSIGLPLPGLHVRIVDPETGKDFPVGQTGEFWLKGRGITPGYWRKAEENKKSFVDGWFRTGDLGHADDEGYYYLTDRMKDIIISGGENISPKEVENVINHMDGIVESCVVGIQDEKWGERVVAAVVKRSEFPLNEEGIKRHCKITLHDWKCPKEVVFFDSLPRNRMGKVLKEEVKKTIIRSGFHEIR
jgi:malonyl-CoA/methylmalonyl-CoA synthetase